MDNKIALGNKLDLEKIETRISADPNKQKTVYSSRVLDESENDKILVAMPIQEGKVIPLSVGQEFFATFYSKSGLLRCQVVITRRFKKGELFLMEIEQKTNLQKVQRREYFRFDCRLPIKYRILEENERKLVERSESYEFDEADVEWKDGIMLDLSGGGIRYVSAFKEIPNSFAQVKFQIEIEEQIETIFAFASLLRSEQNPNNTSIYDNRLFFYKMDKVTREKIIHYIFDAQRKTRSKETGLE